MANPTLFYQTFISDINKFIQKLDDLDTMQDRLASDSTLAAAAAAAAQPTRPDLTAQDFTNAAIAINQLLNTFNGGTPSKKSALYKML